MSHIKADRDSKLITKFEVIPASVHDSQIIEKLVEKMKAKAIYGYSTPKLTPIPVISCHPP